MTPTLEMMRLDLRRLEHRVSGMKKHAYRSKDRFAGYFEPPELDKGCFASLPSAVERKHKFEQALENNDPIEAARHWKCTAANPGNNPDEYWLGLFIRLNFRYEGLAEVLGWLADLEKIVEENTSPTDFVHSFIQIGGDPLDGCDCEPHHMKDPALAWVHNNHGILNKVLWELAIKFGLQRLRRVLYREIRGPENRFEMADGSLSEPNGKILSKSLAQKMLDEYFKPQPDPSWIPAEKETVFA